MIGVNVDMKSTVGERRFAIGELAGFFGLPTHVLRHWESVGLLEPSRLANGRRRYRESDILRVAAIRRARSLGSSLNQVAAVLTATDGTARRAVLTAHRDELHRRAAEAQAAGQLIEHALECSHPNFLECPVMLRNLLAETTAPAETTPPARSPSVDNPPKSS